MHVAVCRALLQGDLALLLIIGLQTCDVTQV